jgi:hypothetical protein
LIDAKLKKFVYDIERKFFYSTALCSKGYSTPPKRRPQSFTKEKMKVGLQAPLILSPNRKKMHEALYNLLLLGLNTAELSFT